MNEYIDLAQKALILLFNWAVANWESIVAVLTASGIIPFLAQAVKRFYEVQSPVKKLLIVYGICTTAMAVNYVMKTPSTSPEIILLQGAGLQAMAVPFYIKIAKPLMLSLVAWAAKQRVQLAAYSAQREQAEAALIEEVPGRIS